MNYQCSPLLCLQFSYKVDKVQLTFLQLLSKEAYQNITYHCKNSTVYFDKASNSFNKAAKFQTYNDLELSPNRRKFRYHVALDECQVTMAIYLLICLFMLHSGGSNEGR